MSTHNKESHYENHQRAAELQNVASHAHNSAAQQHGKQDHQTGPEHSRQTMEHSEQTHLKREPAHANGAHMVPFGHADIAALAYTLWQARGCPEGSADEDWFRAAQQLRSANEHAGGKSNE